MSAATRRRRKQGPPRATLMDVARAAAVSTASASRALARPEAVSEQLRLKVREAAATLGYVPNGAARALVRRRSGLIGVLAGDIEHPGTATALAAIAERLSEAEWALLLASAATDSLMRANVRTLVGLGVEGLIFVDTVVPANLGEVPGAARLPSVGADGWQDAGVGGNAGLLLGRSVRLISDYLRQLGHCSFAVVSEDDSPGAAVFGDALHGASGQAGATLQRLTIGEESIAEVLRRWLALADSPTAAICGSDALALALMHACASTGVDVPGRLSVVGFGDTPLARRVSPTLTSVRIPARSAGLAAADSLLSKIAGCEPVYVELPVKLMVRGSTGPAR